MYKGHDYKLGYRSICERFPALYKVIAFLKFTLGGTCDPHVGGEKDVQNFGWEA